MIYTICKFDVLLDNNLQDLYFLLSMSKLKIIYSSSHRRYLNGAFSENIKVLDSENHFKIEYLDKAQEFAISFPNDASAISFPNDASAISFPNDTHVEYKSTPNIAEILKDISEEEAKLYFEINYK